MHTYLHIIKPTYSFCPHFLYLLTSVLSTYTSLHLSCLLIPTYTCPSCLHLSYLLTHTYICPAYLYLLTHVLLVYTCPTYLHIPTSVLPTYTSLHLSFLPTPSYLHLFTPAHTSLHRLTSSRLHSPPTHTITLFAPLHLLPLTNTTPPCLVHQQLTARILCDYGPCREDVSAK